MLPVHHAYSFKRSEFTSNVRGLALWQVTVTLSVSLLSEVDSGRTESFHATLVPHSDNAELADLAEGGPDFHPSIPLAADGMAFY